VATLTRLTGDLGAAEDAIQEAWEAALRVWDDRGVPDNPRAWLIATARHKAVDALRREARRPEKEKAAMRDLVDLDGPDFLPSDDDDLALLFMCSHPALERGARVALTLRCVCGLTTEEIAAGFLVPEPTMAKRLVRAKQKIRTAGIPFRTPTAEDLPSRLADVLRVVYLVFTEGHMTQPEPPSPASSGFWRTRTAATGGSFHPTRLYGASWRTAKLGESYAHVRFGSAGRGNGRFERTTPRPGPILTSPLRQAAA
jgi:RNA polymerase sigma-70 factor (ECF subfamily)